jgi:cobalt/nickel transport system permease protein
LERYTHGPPQWLLEKGDYDPPPDRDRFLDRSIVSFLRLLSVMRPKGAWRGTETRFNPGVLFASVFVFVLLLSLSRSPFFMLFAAALLLPILAAARGERILAVLKVSIPAAALTSLIMLPSALWGNAGGAVTIVVKVFLSVTAVKLFSETAGWGRISRVLASLRAPALLVLVLDLTFRYVALLGGLSLSMLHALKLRSVGRNADKTASLSGIAGVLFLKSRLMAEDAYAAMECRCFTGRLAAGSAPALRIIDAVPLAADVALALAYILTRALS